MSANPPPWTAVRSLFERVVPLPASERDAALAAARDDALAIEVRSLLAHHEADTGGRLSAGAPAAGSAAPTGIDTAAAAPTTASETRTGQRLGPWRIASLLGRGGMGDVWLAERADGTFEGEAAIKVLKRGMDSAAVLSRFALEQQALARLAHPHIARLLDAGRTPDGLPYFVMERVVGRSIDQACRGQALETRLRLFLQLADAVSHAHRHLLVHRDLKPSNVLVDDDGAVKLLDFGIAKALDPLEGRDDPTTVGGLRPFTPHYASPEQVRGEAVTTATDVYSLGVVLYQMLTGTRPTGRQATTPLEAARSVIEDEPTRPSRLSNSEAREPMWPTLRARVHGDLDNVLLKALDKVPDRRYATVDLLAADIRAFLESRPVAARAASPGYVLLRFMQRNRWTVVAGALGTLGLATGLVATIAQGQVAVAIGAVGMAAGLGIALVQVRQAARARDQAQARFEDLRQLAHHVLFDYHDLVEPLAGSTPVRQRLVNDAITYLDRLAAAAPTDRAVRLEIGMAWRTVGLVQRNGYFRPHLGDTAGAMRSFGEAVAWLEPLVQEDARDDMAAYELALALSARAGVRGEDGDLDAARPELLRAAALFERHIEPDRSDLRHRLELARTHLRLASVLAMRDRPDEALAQVDHARRRLAEMAALSPDHAELPHVWVWVHGMATMALRSQDDWVGVRREVAESQRIMDRLIAREPDNARFQEDMAGLATWQLRAAGALADAAAARLWGERAVTLWGGLAMRDPADRVARRGYLNALVLAGRELATAGAPAEGLQRLAQAEAPIQAACERWPDDADARSRTALRLEAEAETLHLAGRIDEARQRNAEAERASLALLAEMPDEAPALASNLAVQFQRARWQALDALASPFELAPRAAALAQLEPIERERRSLIARQRMPSRDYAWRMEEAPRLLARLRPTPSSRAAP